jgi:UDP-glucose-4-epimerase GalE
VVAILVTGGAGYVGSHTAKALARAGFEPIVLDNLSMGHRSAVKWGPLIEGDLSDEFLLRDIMKKYKVQAVMHFAASAYVGESMTDPRRYFQNNVVNTLKLLEAQIETSVKCIVFSSTCATYGIPQTPLIAEDHPQSPVNPYGESKRFVERALHWFGQAYGLRWVALRYFNAAGADLDGEIGELHEPETHLIPLVIEAALGLRPYVQVFGTDYDTPDGTAVRDYIHVTDLAEAHVRALQLSLSQNVTSAVNLGTGKGYSVRQVIKSVEESSGRKVPFRDVMRRPGDPAHLIADPRRANSLLGWNPKYSDLETIIESAWKWFSSRLAGAAVPDKIATVREKRTLNRPQ